MGSEKGILIVGLFISIPQCSQRLMASAIVHPLGLFTALLIPRPLDLITELWDIHLIWQTGVRTIKATFNAQYDEHLALDSNPSRSRDAHSSSTREPVAPPSAFFDSSLSFFWMVALGYLFPPLASIASAMRCHFSDSSLFSTSFLAWRRRSSLVNCQYKATIAKQKKKTGTYILLCKNHKVGLHS